MDGFNYRLGVVDANEKKFNTDLVVPESYRADEMQSCKSDPDKIIKSEMVSQEAKMWHNNRVIRKRTVFDDPVSDFERKIDIDKNYLKDRMTWDYEGINKLKEYVDKIDTIDNKAQERYGISEEERRFCLVSRESALSVLNDYLENPARVTSTKGFNVFGIGNAEKTKFFLLYKLEKYKEVLSYSCELSHKSPKRIKYVELQKARAYIGLRMFNESLLEVNKIESCFGFKKDTDEVILDFYIGTANFSMACKHVEYMRVKYCIPSSTCQVMLKNINISEETHTNFHNLLKAAKRCYNDKLYSTAETLLDIIKENYPHLFNSGMENKLKRCKKIRVKKNRCWLSPDICQTE